MKYMKYVKAGKLRRRLFFLYGLKLYGTPRRLSA